MKTILLLVTCYLCLCSCNSGAGQDKRKVKSIFSVVSDTINYQLKIQPILQKTCSPCHFPGGKMYAKMPFDNGKTIVDHQAGILKRIKDEQQVVLIKQYIQQKTK